MCADEGPMNKQRVSAMRDAAKTLRGKVNQNYETTAGETMGAQYLFLFLSSVRDPKTLILFVSCNWFVMECRSFVK